MEDKTRVRIVYRNERLEPVYEKEYGLDEYTELMKLDLLRLITDIEDVIYECNDGNPKDEWPDNVWLRFCKIKHKILDKAGEIGRLPDNIRRWEEYGGKDSLGQKSEHPECQKAYSSGRCEEHEGLSSASNARG